MNDDAEVSAAGWLKNIACRKEGSVRICWRSGEPGEKWPEVEDGVPAEVGDGKLGGWELWM